LAPTPGSFFSSSINRDMGSANLDIGELSNFMIGKFDSKTSLEHCSRC
jgi:hypothetical protein